MRDIAPAAKGRITLFEVTDGEWRQCHQQDNMVTYSGADAMALMATGSSSINAIYLVYRNDPGAINITADKSNTADVYGASVTNRGVVRITTLGEAALTSSAAEYEGNKATFMGVSDGTTMFPSTPVTDGVSVFYHAALVCAPNISDQEDDIIFSCADFSTVQTKVAGAQLGVKWEIIFLAP
jgi:hypothetical protein